MARELVRSPGMVEGRFRADRYGNGEWHVSLGADVAGKECVVLGTVTPPADSMVALGILVHTLKKEGARRITALLPYLAYARADKDHERESMGAAWLGGFLASSGVDEVVTVDLHSDRDRVLFPIPIVSLSPATLFARAFGGRRLRDAVVVAPDRGAIPQCEAARTALGILRPAAYFEKHRHGRRMTQCGPFGDVGETAILIDDIFDTGMTLSLAVRALRKRGVRSIFVAATHGLFTDLKFRPDSVAGMVVTDTIPRTKGPPKGVKVLSVIPLLKGHFGARYA